MLEHYFKSATKLQKLRHRPLFEHIDGLAIKLFRHGYTCASGHRILGMTGKFNDFALVAGIEKAEIIDESLVDRFLRDELASCCGHYHDAPSAMRHMLEPARITPISSQNTTQRASREQDGSRGAKGKSYEPQEDHPQQSLFMPCVGSPRSGHWCSDSIRHSASSVSLCFRAS